MNAPVRRASVLALAAVVALSGCASAYNFSPRLDTHVPGAAGKAPADRDAKAGLAGDLDLALAGLMDQRRQLWTAAGELDQLKNATVLGLIGLGAAGLYRGLESDLNKGWLARAGLLASATYTGAQWLEPDARRQVNLQGATALTCLALATAPYEMRKKEQADLKIAINGARQGLEELASALRSVGRVTKGSDTYWLVRNGWNKLRFASGVLRSADAAMGTIEATGPRLRDATALLASDTADQVSRVTRRLEDLPAALETLKPNVALLIGTPLPSPPTQPRDDEPLGVDGAVKPAASNDGDSDAGATGAAASCKADDAADKVGGAGAKGGPAAADAATPGASEQRLAAIEGALQAIERRLGLAAKAQPQAAPASTPAQLAKAQAEQQAAQRQAAVQAAEDKAELARQRRQEAADLPALSQRLRAAMAQLDQHLGAVNSFALRVTSAQKRQTLPKACQATATVVLVPERRSITLQAGESFQYLLEGDTGRAEVTLVGDALGRELLDISMPLGASASGTAVRLTAGAGVGKPANAVVRLADSRGKQSWDIAVKLCPATKP